MPGRSSWSRTGSCSTFSRLEPSWEMSFSISPSSPSSCGTWTPLWAGGWSWCGSGSCTWVSAPRTWSGGLGPPRHLWWRWRCSTTRSTACRPHMPCRARPSPSPCSSWPTAAGRYSKPVSLAVKAVKKSLKKAETGRSYFLLISKKETEKVPFVIFHISLNLLIQNQQLELKIRKLHLWDLHRPAGNKHYNLKTFVWYLSLRDHMARYLWSAS